MPAPEPIVKRVPVQNHTICSCNFAKKGTGMQKGVLPQERVIGPSKFYIHMGTGTKKEFPLHTALFVLGRPPLPRILKGFQCKITPFAPANAKRGHHPRKSFLSTRTDCFWTASLTAKRFELILPRRGPGGEPRPLLPPRVRHPSAGDLRGQALGPRQLGDVPGMAMVPGVNWPCFKSNAMVQNRFGIPFWDR